jgi:hypothetical protein
MSSQLKQYVHRKLPSVIINFIIHNNYKIKYWKLFIHILNIKIILLKLVKINIRLPNVLLLIPHNACTKPQINKLNRNYIQSFLDIKIKIIIKKYNKLRRQ